MIGVARPRKTEWAYRTTNESLNAIMLGLAVSSEDTVFAIGGSGDQAFAMLERAGKVKVTDMFESQLDFIERRREALVEWRIPDFLGHSLKYTGDNTAEDAARRNMYFTQAGRLGMIRRNLRNLEILPAQDVEIEVNGSLTGVNKVYLSNIFLHWGPSKHYQNCTGLFTGTVKNIRDHLPINGLIYITGYGRHMGNIPGTLNYFQETIPVGGLELDKPLTETAVEAEAEQNPTWPWFPVVLRKVK